MARVARVRADHDPIPLDHPFDDARVLIESGMPVVSDTNLPSRWPFQTALAGGDATPTSDVSDCGGVTAFVKIARRAGPRHRL